MRLLTIVMLPACSVFLLLVMIIGLLEFDFYGRYTERKLLKKGDKTSPSILIVLHRLVPDENGVDASMILLVSDAATMKAIKTGATGLAATVTDGSHSDPALRERITLDREVVTRSGEFVVESKHFLLPTEPSLGLYPYDVVSARPTVTLVRLEDGAPLGFSLHAQKALPSRVLDIEGASIMLRRPRIQKYFILIMGVIFWCLAAVVAYELFSASGGLTSFQETLAVAGFLVTIVGFRDLLGFSRLPATGASEVLVIGVPILLVTTGIVMSQIRKRRAESQFTH